MCSGITLPLRQIDSNLGLSASPDALRTAHFARRGALDERIGRCGGVRPAALCAGARVSATVDRGLYGRVCEVISGLHLRGREHADVLADRTPRSCGLLGAATGNNGPTGHMCGGYPG